MSFKTKDNKNQRKAEIRPPETLIRQLSNGVVISIKKNIVASPSNVSLQSRNQEENDPNGDTAKVAAEDNVSKKKRKNRKTKVAAAGTVGSSDANVEAKVEHFGSGRNKAASSPHEQASKKGRRRPKRKNNKTQEVKFQLGSLENEKGQLNDVAKVTEQPDSAPVNVKESSQSLDKSLRRRRKRENQRSRGNSKSNGNNSEAKSKLDFPWYKSYYDAKKIKKMLCNETQQKLIFEGTLRVNHKKPENAYVTVTGLDRDILIPSKLLQNRALNGDEVVIELLAGAQLSREMRFLEKDNARFVSRLRSKANIAALEKLPTLDIDIELKERNYLLAKVVSVSHSYFQHKFISGHIRFESRFDKDARIADFCMFAPSSQALPLVMIPRSEVPASLTKSQAEKEIWSACITEWSEESKYPTGKLGVKLGLVGSLKIESEAILQDNQCNWGEFPAEALACLPPVPWVITADEVAKRTDFRNRRIFSIDPVTAKDLDDAVSIVKLGSDRYELGVHIADVSHFVPAKSALDKEAGQRATTVYLVEKAVPMLPKLLCEELCSLNPGVDRFAFSVVWHVDGAGNVLDAKPWFGKSVIRSCAKMSYSHAQSIIEGHTWDVSGLPECELHGGVTFEDVKQDILILYRMTRAIRERRYKGGALSMQSIKLWFALDPESLCPTDCGVYEQKEANKLIEELMLMANMAVAKKLSEHCEHGALLRHHMPPDSTQLKDFLETARGLGYEFDASSSGSFQKSFDSIQDPLHRFVLRLLAIKPMLRANYFCYNSKNDNGRHYALNVPLYTHFTSPIRRYCDLVVHRHLHKVLCSEEPEHDIPLLEAVAKVCNKRKELAKSAQDASSKLFLCHYIDKLCATLRTPELVAMGTVYGVSRTKYQVLVPSMGLEMAVYLEDLVNEGFAKGCEFDADKKLVKVHFFKNPVSKNTRKSGASSVDELSETVKSALTLSPRETEVVEIKTFSVVPVRIKLLKNHRPYRIKMSGLHPDLSIYQHQCAIVERELCIENYCKDGVVMGVFDNVDASDICQNDVIVASCPGMLADGD